jgi:hypothetical protein
MSISSASRISHRISVARTRRRSINNDLWYRTHGGASLAFPDTTSLGPTSGIFRRP